MVQLLFTGETDIYERAFPAVCTTLQRVLAVCCLKPRNLFVVTVLPPD